MDNTDVLFVPLKTKQYIFLKNLKFLFKGLLRYKITFILVKIKDISSFILESLS